MSQWIKFIERKPQTDGRYLVIENYLYRWVGVSAMRNGKFDMTIKYWQPLPDLPDELKDQS